MSQSQKYCILSEAGIKQRQEDGINRVSSFQLFFQLRSREHVLFSVFFVHFIRQFWMPYLNPTIEHLCIKLGDNSVKRRVRLTEGTDVRAATIKVGDIFAFVFTVRRNKLRLTANRL